MADLTFVPFEDIVAELNRRFPAFVIAVTFVPEGKKNPGERISWGGRSESLPACFGLANMAVDQLRAFNFNNSQRLMGQNPPLDPPSPKQQ
jgi:hypothetical protein